MAITFHMAVRTAIMGSALITLVACDENKNFDFDMRRLGNGFNTADAAQSAQTAARPQTDSRGVISYPNYQVAVARRGDRIQDVATRVGLSADALANYNGIPQGAVLREGEVIVLPTRVTEPSFAGNGITTGPIGAGGVDVSTLAGQAIDRADQGQSVAAAPLPAANEPVRHKVVRGETAFSIARLYNVSSRALSDWNGLGPDMAVREGQYLLIPVTIPGANTVAAVEQPGTGSATPLPPSSATPLPAPPAKPAAVPASPNTGTATTGNGRLLMPVDGKIIRPYVKKKNDGIDIAAAAGTSVKAAADGTVAAITRDTEQVPIIVLRHADNLLTVYAGVDNVTLKKGDTVKRGQTIAKVRTGNPSFLHFEVRQGFDSVDPVPFLN